MIIREGIVPILATTLVATGVQVLVGFPWAVAPWLLLVLLGRIFWLPVLRMTPDPLGILSPVSGKVTGIEADTDPFRDCPVIRIRLRPAPPGITLLRYPIEGQVQDIYLRSGVLGATLRPTTVNESPDCYAQCLRTDEGEEVLYAVSSRWPVSRCSLDRSPGERAGQGQRAGFFYFASFVDVLMPTESLVQVAVGDRVRAGESQLARLSR